MSMVGMAAWWAVGLGIASCSLDQFITQLFWLIALDDFAFGDYLL
jgi:hypothetical protein